MPKRALMLWCTWRWLWLQVRAARRVAQGRAKPVDWLVQDLYGLGEDDGGQEFRNDEADDSEEEREELRRQVCKPAFSPFCHLPGRRQCAACRIG